MSDDDMPQLSSTTLAALQEFYAEQAAEEEKVKAALLDPKTKDQNVFQADWQLSQFWYSEETASALASEAIRVTENRGKIALISCPTLYPKLKSLSPGSLVTLLEYDKRFAVYDGFVYYDYKDPLNLPNEFERSFDVVIADPPFLSEECLSRVSETLKFMAKDKIILCTGAVMQELAKQLLNLKTPDKTTEQTSRIVDIPLIKERELGEAAASLQNGKVPGHVGVQTSPVSSGARMLESSVSYEQPLRETESSLSDGSNRHWFSGNFEKLLKPLLLTM
ncbi:Protein-lysine N-methyltransferase CG9154, partial [Gryllus bimaculatus]